MRYYVEEHIENFKAWSGGRDTLETIRAYNKLDELEDYLQEVFIDSTPSATDINDFLWFKSNTILNDLGIDTRTIKEKFSDICNDDEVEAEIKNIIGSLKYNSNGVKGVLDIAQKFNLEYTENLEYNYISVYKCYDNMVELSIGVRVDNDRLSVVFFNLDEETFEVNDILSEV